MVIFLQGTQITAFTHITQLHRLGSGLPQKPSICVLMHTVLPCRAPHAVPRPAWVSVSSSTPPHASQVADAQQEQLL